MYTMEVRQGICVKKFIVFMFFKANHKYPHTKYDLCKLELT